MHRRGEARGGVDDDVDPMNANDRLFPFAAQLCLTHGFGRFFPSSPFYIHRAACVRVCIVDETGVVCV